MLWRIFDIWNHCALENGAQKFMTVKKFVKPRFALRFAVDFALSRVRIVHPRFSAQYLNLSQDFWFHILEIYYSSQVLKNNAAKTLLFLWGFFSSYNQIIIPRKFVTIQNFLDPARSYQHLNFGLSQPGKNHSSQSLVVKTTCFTQYLSLILLILKINTTFEDVQMILK